MTELRVGLSREDAAEVERIRGNLTRYHRARQVPPAGRGPDFYPEWAGVFEVNVEQLLEVIGRLVPRELVPTGTGWPGEAAS